MAFASPPNFLGLKDRANATATGVIPAAAAAAAEPVVNKVSLTGIAEQLTAAINSTTSSAAITTSAQVGTPAAATPTVAGVAPVAAAAVEVAAGETKSPVVAETVPASAVTPVQTTPRETAAIPSAVDAAVARTGTPPVDATAVTTATAAAASPVVPGTPTGATSEDPATAAARLQLPVINETLFLRLRGHYARLSRQKFSSNVVEKCLKIPDQGIRSAIISELIENDAIATLLLCSYGNYVLQNVLYVASSDECALLFSRVRPEHILASLRKNIRLKWERLLANAHLIHPALTGLNLGAGLSTPAMQPPITPNLATGAHNPGFGLNVDVTSPDASASNPSASPVGTPAPALGTPTPAIALPVIGSGAPQYPTPAAIQLITSILGANTPGTGIGLADDMSGGRMTPGGLAGGMSAANSSMSTPISQLSPAIRSVNHSPMTGPRGSYSSSSRGTPQIQQIMPQQQPPYQIMQYPNPNKPAGILSGPDRRVIMGSGGSQNTSAVNSPYYTPSAGPSPGFAPHRGSAYNSGYGGSSATSPMLGANSPYGAQNSSSQYSNGGYSSRDRDGRDRDSGGYHSQAPNYQSNHNDYSQPPQQQHHHQQSPQYRSTPNYPSSTNYNTNPGQAPYGSQQNGSANSPSIKYITPPVQQQQQPSSRSQSGGGSGSQSIEQQIRAHQDQLNALLALQAQQQPPSTGAQYSVTLLPASHGQQQAPPPQQQYYSSSRSSHNANPHPTSPPLHHQVMQHQQYQPQYRDDRY